MNRQAGLNKGWLRFAAIAAVVAVAYVTGAGDFLEQRLTAMRFQVLEREASGNVVIVAIDAPSLQALDPWPWSRRHHAEVVERLMAAGARRVALDLDFRSAGDPLDDAAFAEALARHRGKVVLPLTRVWEQDAAHGARLVVAKPLPQFRDEASLGLVDVATGADGLTRCYSARVDTGEGHLPGFASALLDRQAHLPDSFQIDFGIEPATVPRLSYAAVLSGDFDRALVRDRAVIVGATAVELAPYRAVPRFDRLPMPVVHALAFESLVQDRALTSVPAWIVVAGGFLLAFVAGPRLEATDWRRGMLITAAGCIGLLLVSLAIQGDAPLTLDVTPWIATLLGCYGVEMARRLDQQGIRLLIQGSKVHKAETLMRHVVENSFDAVLTLRSDGTVATWNRTAQRMFGRTAEQALGRNVGEFIALPPENGQKAGALARIAASGEPCEVVGRSAAGPVFPVELTVSAMAMEGEQLHVACMRDITERKAQQELLRHQATHDSLTDLPNRYLLEERVDDALNVARDTHGPVAFLLLDLDRFKEINDALGHHTGDVLLQHVAERLQGALRPCDTIARLGGDEFAVLLPNTDEIGARQAAHEMTRLLGDPFDVDGLVLQADTAVGIALFPQHGTNAEQLFQQADVAMYSAKRSRAGVAVYDPQQNPSSMRQLTLTSELRHAIDKDEGLALWYQPKVDARSSRVVGAEALIRWHHAKLGNIRPDEFIGLAENSGLIRPLTNWVLRTALAQCARWEQSGQPLGISVNISARNLLEEDLPRNLAMLLAHAGVSPARLTLEITENVLMENPEAALEVVTELASMGVAISIDDFGTGYSSLGYLRRLPAEEIKIDRCFIMDMDRSNDDATIVRSTIELAHNLGRRVVAEGVEKRETWETLRRHGCDYGQGYLFSRPLPAADLMRWLAREYPERARLTTGS